MFSTKFSNYEKSVMIKIEDLSIYYDNVQIVEQVNLEIKEQDYLVILGENGSGKSTLVKALLGLNKNISGRITIENIAIEKYQTWEKFGYVAQKNVIAHDIPITVLEYLALYYQDQEKLQQMIIRFKIEELLPKKLNDLSGGQFQKVSIVKALSQKLKYLILDEPDNSLDLTSKYEIYKILTALNQEGLTIIMISHNIEHLYGRKKVYNLVTKKMEE